MKTPNGRQWPDDDWFDVLVLGVLFLIAVLILIGLLG